MCNYNVFTDDEEDSDEESEDESDWDEDEDDEESEMGGYDLDVCPPGCDQVCILWLLLVRNSYGPQWDKICLRGFPKRSYPNQTAKLQILPRKLKFRLLQV